MDINPGLVLTPRQKIFREIKDYLMIALGMVLYGIGWTVFLLPNDIATGAVPGIASIVYWATGFPVQYTYFIINAFLLMLSLKIMGWKFSVKTIFAVFILTLFLSIIQKITNGMALLHDQPFMACVLGASCCGSGIGIAFSANGSTGGTDIVAASVNKYHNISLGKVLILVDLCIIGSCLFVDSFGALDVRCKKVVFGLCTMFIECFMLDYVMNWQRQSVQFLIFSKHYKEIAKAITDKTDHSLTILDGHGWYTGREMKVICLLAKKNESVTIFRLIKMIDPNAFVSQSSVIGVYGEGFDQIKVKVKKNEDSIRDKQQS